MQHVHCLHINNLLLFLLFEFWWLVNIQILNYHHHIVRDLAELNKETQTYSRWISGSPVASSCCCEHVFQNFRFSDFQFVTVRLLIILIIFLFLKVKKLFKLNT